MGEIGIEKLGELLREYSYENHDYYWTLYVNGKFEGSVPGTDHDLSNKEMGMVIKSKEYGFIKWLVENDKIDFEGKLNTIRFESLVDQTLDSYLALLMLLAIQDNPIDLLCGILK